MYISAYLCIAMHIYAYSCTSMHINVYLCIFLCIAMHIYAYLCISMHIYAYLCISVHSHAYLCVELLGTTQTVLTASPGGGKNGRHVDAPGGVRGGWWLTAPTPKVTTVTHFESARRGEGGREP